MSFGKLMIAALVEEGSVDRMLKLGPVDHLFKGAEPPVWEFVKGFVSTHGQLPKSDTVTAHTGEKLPTPKEPVSYYVEQMRIRHKELVLKDAIKNAGASLQPDNLDVDKALGVMAETVMSLVRSEFSNQIADFRDAYDLIVPEYVAKAQGTISGGLRLGWPTLDDMTNGLGVGDLLSMVGRPGAGKALRHGTPVIMADGSAKPIEKIVIGDAVASVDGAPSTIFGVYAQGARPVLRVTFGDGRQLDVDEDHLWLVGCKYWDGPRVMSTREIVRWRSKAKRFSSTLWVPLASGDFGGARTPLLDPYLLGVLIGDGSLTGHSPSFTTMDVEIRDRVEKALPSGVVLRRKASSSSGAADDWYVVAEDGKTTKVNPVKEALVAYRLWGKTSSEKTLPEGVFMWSKDHRLALMRGLMDTDGTVDAKSSVTFSSSSLGLVKGVARLARSLGWKAQEQGPRKTTHQDHWRVTIVAVDRGAAFSIARKVDRCRKHTTHDPEHLKIVSIEPAGVHPCTCIAVTHPARLFLAGDYVVTHNTLQLLFAALHGWSTPAVEGVQDQSRLFVSMEMPILQIEQRMAAIHTHLPGGKLKQGKLASKSFTKLKKGLKELKGFPHPFWIVDGNLAATVEDVTLLARQLNPAAIFIDGGYLLKHPSERDRYKRVAENADLIKSMLCPIAPTVVSWQFSRSGGKKHLKKGEKPTMDDIGYTDAIAQVSSLILGITQAENVETLKARQIDVLKGRFGETGSFLTNWNWETMDFSEIVEKNVEDMHYD